MTPKKIITRLVPIALFGYINSMDQQRAEKIGFVCIAVACAMGGAGSALAFAGLLTRSTSDSSFTRSVLLFFVFLGLASIGFAVWAMTTHQKSYWTASQKQSRTLALAVLVGIMACVNCVMLGVNISEDVWKSTQFMSTSSMCSVFSFMLQSLGTMLRLPAVDSESSIASHSEQAVRYSDSH